MLYQVMIKSPEGTEIELIATESVTVAEGAKMGAEALLNLLADDMDLEEGYQVILRPDTLVSSGSSSISHQTYSL